MKTSRNGQAVMHHYETCELEAYPDPASELGKACTSRKLLMRDYRKVPAWQDMNGSPWTIGWGHTGPEVRQGLKWDQQTADVVFAQDLQRFESGVIGALKVGVNQGQFDALVSFAYNVGLGNLRSSTLLKMLNAGNAAGAALQFGRWNKAQGKEMLGLSRRRKSEKALFEGDTAAKAIEQGAMLK